MSLYRYLPRGGELIDETSVSAVHESSAILHYNNEWYSASHLGAQHLVSGAKIVILALLWVHLKYHLWLELKAASPSSSISPANPFQGAASASASAPGPELAQTQSRPSRTCVGYDTAQARALPRT